MDDTNFVLKDDFGREESDIDSNYGSSTQDRPTRRKKHLETILVVITCLVAFFIVLLGELSRIFRLRLVAIISMLSSLLIYVALLSVILVVLPIFLLIRLRAVLEKHPQTRNWTPLNINFTIIMCLIAWFIIFPFIFKPIGVLLFPIITYSAIKVAGAYAFLGIVGTWFSIKKWTKCKTLSKAKILASLGILFSIAMIIPVQRHLYYNVYHRRILLRCLNSSYLREVLYNACDSDGNWPVDKWCSVLVENGTITNLDYFKCPGDEIGPCSYAINKNTLGIGQKIPDDMVLLFESKPGWNQVGGPELLNPYNHHSNKCLIVFGNLDAKHVKFEEAKNLRWTLDTGNEHNQSSNQDGK